MSTILVKIFATALVLSQVTTRPDAVKPDDLKQSAVFFAVMTWQAAMRDERIPRSK